MHLRPPEAVPSLPGSGQPAYAELNGIAFEGCCGSGGERRRPPLATSRLGIATGGRVEAAAARQGRTCWIASVCSCAAGNYWAMLPVVSPKRPVWDIGTLRNRTCRHPYVNQTQPEVRCGAELFQNFRIMTTPCMSLSPFSLKNLQ